MATPMNGPYPGEKLSDRDKAALEKDNRRETQQAHEMAARQREIDMHEGRGGPVDQQIANGIKKKLEREEFNKP